MILSGGGYVLCWVCHLDIFRRSKDRKDSLYMGQVSGSYVNAIVLLAICQLLVLDSLYAVCNMPIVLYIVDMFYDVQ